MAVWRIRFIPSGKSFACLAQQSEHQPVDQRTANHQPNKQNQRQQQRLHAGFADGRDLRSKSQGRHRHGKQHGIDLVWLLREPGSSTREATDQLLLPHLRSYRHSIEIGSSEAIKHAAAEGFGAACLSQWVASDLIKSKRLCRIPTTLPKLIRQCYLVVHHDKQASPALLRFIAQATSLLSPSANNETGKPSL